MPFAASSGTSFEALFHATSLELIIPSASSIPTGDSAESWWESVLAAPSRHISFLDEKLFYVVALSVPYHLFQSSSSSSEPPSELLRFLARLQLTATASLLPPLAARSRSAPLMVAPDANNLFVPQTSHVPQTPDTSAPPVTPNPFPRMGADEAQYASVEGVTVWEGAVDSLEGKTGGDETVDGQGIGGGLEDVNERDDTRARGGRVIVRGKEGWDVVYKGQVPVVYVRTQIQNPVLSLTTSVTLRDRPQKAKKAGTNAETGSIHSAADTVRTDGTEEAVGEDEDMAGMEEIDLLGGLGEERLPSSRLASSIREDLSLTALPFLSAPPTATGSFAAHRATSSIDSAPFTAGPSRDRHPPALSLSHSNHTLRKSFRRVLSLSSGLRVRMRTLFLPQLLPPRSAHDAEEEDEGERRVALCVEVENPMDGESLGFEIESISVDVGGKGGKASAELLCQPEQHRQDESSSKGVFPLMLDPIEQYNLLYAVSIASAMEDRQGNGDALARTVGKGDEQRPVGITVIGRPVERDGHIYPTDRFSSRWNCTLDLAPFYASSNALSHTLPRPGSLQPAPTPPNAVVGDKRFSLTSLAAQAPRAPQQRVPSGPVRPPPGGRATSLREPNGAQHGVAAHGLLVSVKVLEQDGAESNARVVNALEPFSLEVFIQNRTEEVQRFRVSIPAREEVRGLKELWAKRRRRRPEEPTWGQDDPVLKQLLSAHLTSAPSLVSLEDDVRCGPLLPGESMSARIRFLALREGVHTLDKLRVTGANEEFDFVLSPVLDVVVGSGLDHS